MQNINDTILDVIVDLQKEKTAQKSAVLNSGFKTLALFIEPLAPGA